MLLVVNYKYIMKLDYTKLSWAIHRAEYSAARGKFIKYKMGHGGTHPEDDLPTRDGLCDCSGAVSHFISLNRNPKSTRPWYLETTNIVNNARGRLGKVKVFTELAKPVPGCLVVYGDRLGRQGHIALVTDIVWDSNGRIKSILGIDCSSGQSKKTGRAIHKRNLDFFLAKNSIFVVPTEWILEK